MSKFTRLWMGLSLVLLLVLAISAPASAQSTTGTLTGTVTDKSEAVIPNATVTLTNEQSGDTRRTVTNAAGYFTIAAIPAGSYNITVEAAGFQKWERTSLTFNGADKRNLSDIVLQVGTTGEQVTVMSAVDLITPVDSGEKSAVLTTKQLQDFSVVGRSAAEFIKIMPGFAMVAPSNTENRASFTGEVIGINGNGDGGSQSALNNAYSVNGLPTNSLDITADGAHVSDPGCNCATPVNPNTDMIQEFKVLTSNFSAENSKGPAVINSIAKSGTRDFHGEAYIYARHAAMNANDAFSNSLGLDKNTHQMIAPRPNNKFFFPGGNIGGPVLIPGTGFNKNRDKLFFFSGFEYYYQTLDTGVLTTTVPTAGMRNGDFSPAELAKLGKVTASGGAPQVPSTDLFPNGIIPKAQIDPGGQAMMNLFPLPNADPYGNGGYNYVKQVEFDQNSWQWMSRVDYSISDNTKLFVRYNLQKERQLFPVGLWWRNAAQVPYPTPIVGKNESQSISASLTHVFSPSLTNEFVFGFTYITFPNVFEDPSKVDRTKVGYPYKGLYKNNVAQIPSITGWGGEFGTILNPGGFETGGSKGLFADKYLPSFSDNISKVWGTHTAKFGAFYEYVINNQPANGNSNGQIIEANWGGNTTGSAYADLLTGRAAQYSEQNFNPLHNEAYHTIEFFGQDSWKITRRLTLEYGLRASHFGNWYDRQGIGFAVFAPNTINAKAAPSDYTGLLWHKRDSSIPLSGFPGTGMQFAPRFGMAYDIFGSGKTVFRGGWGMYYFHNAQFTQGLDAPAGVQTQTLNNVTLADVEKTNPQLGSIGVDSVSRTDDKVPQTQSYSATISQRIFGASLLEISYVGNQTKNILNQSGVGTNVNAVPGGTFLNSPVDPNGISSGDYDARRPFTIYQDLHVAQHNLFSNYNSLQVSWLRQRGRLNAQVNYTYGKAMGVFGGDQFNLNNDYGPLPTDRRHIFNAAYSIELGNPVKDNKFVKGVVNGWQLSGITQVQSGVNLTGSWQGGTNLNMNVNGFKLPNGYSVTSRTITGTDSITLEPYVTCNPGANLKEHQYINGACFALPTTPGKNGPQVLPEVFGPAFFNSDLSLFKNFQISESKKVQFRFQAYNFLNHPLWSFRNASSNANLSFDGATGQINNPNFGYATEKQGRRIIQLALKYYF